MQSPLRLSTAGATTLASVAPNGLALVCTQNLGDRQPAAYMAAPGQQATPAQIAALINAAARTFSVPAGYGPMWLIVPAVFLRNLFLGTGIAPPTENLELSAELGVDAQGQWGSALLASGLFTSFAPTVLPLPVLDC